MDLDQEQPSIEVDQIERTSSETRGQWLLRWRLQNRTTKPLRLISVRVPHGKFKADERIFAPKVAIAAKDHADIQLSISCNEPPESIIENAFLIFAIEWREKRWRLFVRLQVKIDQGGFPETRIESITIQEIGFSGLHD